MVRGQPGVIIDSWLTADVVLINKGLSQTLRKDIIAVRHACPLRTAELRAESAGRDRSYHPGQA
jgi:hypothetical protein